MAVQQRAEAPPFFKEYWQMRAAGSMEPVFMLGFARSGTTWLNAVIRDNLKVGLVNEGQFIVSYGEHLNAGEQIRNLEEFVEKLSRSPFFDKMQKVYGIAIDWREILDLDDPDYSQVITSVLAQISRQQGKELIGSKSPGFGWKIDTLTRHFPKSRIIYLIRDGRDCALSHYRMSWGCQNAYVAATRWRKNIEMVRAAAQRHEGGYLELRYEDLLARPAMEFERLAHFVRGTDYDPADAKFFASQIGEDAYEHRTGRWKTEMTESDQTIFESVAGQRLAEEGYEVRGLARPISSGARMGYILSNRLKREYLHAARKISARLSTPKT